MASRPSSTVLPGVITSLCLDTVSARMGVGHMGVNALKILMGSHLSFFPFPPFPRDSVSVIAEVQRFHGPPQVKYWGCPDSCVLIGGLRLSPSPLQLTIIFYDGRFLAVLLIFFLQRTETSKFRHSLTKKRQLLRALSPRPHWHPPFAHSNIRDPILTVW